MTYAKRPSRRAAVGSVTAALVSIAVMAANVSAGLLGIARDDRYSTAFETRLVVAEPGVLANDVDIGSNATAELTDDVAHGIVALEEDGSFEYEPDDGFAGTDRFDYRVANSVTGLLLSATVTITVAPAPATPTPTPAPTAPPTPAPTPAPTPTPPPLPLPTLPPLPLPTIDLPLPTPDVPLPTPTIPPPPGSPRPGVSPTPAVSPTSGTSPSPAPSSPGVAAGGATGTGPAGGGDGPGGPGSGLNVVGTGSGGAGPGVSVDVDVGFPMTLFVPTLVLTVPGLLVMLAVLAQGLGALAWLPFVRRDLGDFGLVRRRGRDPRDRS